MFNHITLVAHENGSGRQTLKRGVMCMGDTVVSSEWEGAGEVILRSARTAEVHDHWFICLIFFCKRNLFNSESCCM